MNPPLRPIKIRSRLGEFQGLTDEQVAIFDRLDPKAHHVVRHYILLHEAAKLMYEPWGWKERWYIDVVQIEWLDADMLKLDDLYLDIIVEGNGPTYRLIDIEELADALLNRQVSIEVLHAPLHGLQRFLDNHLHGGKDFPPAAIQPFQAVPALPSDCVA